MAKTAYSGTDNDEIDRAVAEESDEEIAKKKEEAAQQAAEEQVDIPVSAVDTIKTMQTDGSLVHEPPPPHPLPRLLPHAATAAAAGCSRRPGAPGSSAVLTAAPTWPLGACHVPRPITGISRPLFRMTVIHRARGHYSDLKWPLSMERGIQFS